MLIVSLAAFSLAWPEYLQAAGGTSIVASPGQRAYLKPAWPEGVDALVNDPARTDGWNSWFSEWPNDVNQYALKIKATAELNRLIAKLAAVKSNVRQIRLSYLKEPRGLGWVTSVPEGNGIPVIFSIGDQSRIDEWFKHVRKPFGKMKFVAAPVAVPPTLTIFVQHELVDLDQLDIPAGVEVSAGYVPTVFQKFNTTLEKQREEEAAEKLDGIGITAELNTDDLEPSAKQAAEKIRAFLKRSTDHRDPQQD